jgi:hypothetical protein
LRDRLADDVEGQIVDRLETDAARAPIGGRKDAA